MSRSNYQKPWQSTPWSVVLQAADPSTPAGQRAVGKLFEMSWYPLYTFLRRSGNSRHEAEDLLQGFFAGLVEKKMLAGLAAERGRFRNFLLVCLKRYAANEFERASAIKRGGGRKPLSIDVPPADFDRADQRYGIEPATQLTPEKIYERTWALATLDRALEQLATVWNEAGKTEQYEVLKQYLTDSQSAPSHAHTAEQLGMSAGAVKTAVHRLRAQFREILCGIVAETLDREELLEDELRHLFAALRV